VTVLQAVGASHPLASATWVVWMRHGWSRRGRYHQGIPLRRKPTLKQVLGVDVQPAEVKMRVLDIPAFDMTDAPSPVVAPPTRKTAMMTGEPTARRRDGSVGRETFEQVEALVKQGKNKSEAFKQVAADTGKNAGTVHAAYYRVALASSAVKPRKARAKAAPAAATRRRQKAAQSVRRPSGVKSGDGRGSVDQIVRQLVASVQALTEAVKAQDAEVRELRGRLNGVRSILV
jgi:hypothetical protein